jgi:DNA polymerase zeta
MPISRSFPRYSTSSLTSWYNSQYPTHVIKVLQYYVNKTSIYMEMMDAAEICTKNA